MKNRYNFNFIIIFISSISISNNITNYDEQRNRVIFLKDSLIGNEEQSVISACGVVDSFEMKLTHRLINTNGKVKINFIIVVIF